PAATENWEAATDLSARTRKSSPPFFLFNNRKMEAQVQDAVLPKSRVKVSFSLGSETYAANAKNGILSEQLTTLKEESMAILKDYITKHNVPNDVPDEPLEESSSEDDDTTHETTQVKSKKTKIT
ncbi:hypothetical protein TorRG33x02_251970, partial [Trema orientale]